MDIQPSGPFKTNGDRHHDHKSDLPNDRWREVILENALDAVIGVTSEDVIVDWNRQAERIFGWSKSEVVGKRSDELFISGDSLERRSDGNKHEVQAVRRNGSLFFAELSVIPIVVSGKNFFYSFVREVEARRMGERAALRRLESQYAITSLLATAESVDQAVYQTLEEIGRSLGWEIGIYWQMNEDKSALEVRSSWVSSDRGGVAEFLCLSRTLKFGPGEGMPGTIWVSGEPVWREISPADKLTMPRAQSAIAAGFTSAMWFPLKRKAKNVKSDETIGIFEFTGRQALNRDEDLFRALEATSYQVAQFIDRLEAKDAAEKAARESQAVNRVKDEFLASLSHELRTPLTAILGFAEVLRDDFEFLSNAEKMDCIDGILRNATVQTEMISDLLDVSRIITGKVAFTPDHVSIASVAKNVVDNFAATASAKNVRLSVEIGDVPEFIFADSVRIQQILWNLVANAIKFTPSGGSIVMRVFTEDNQCLIDVTDSGAGIEPEFLPYVFDRFRQEDSSITRKFGGLGLGLSISRHLAEIHGGSMRAFSRGKGFGSTFRVCLPLRDDPIPPVQPAKFADVSQTEASDLRQKRSLAGVRILLVEDSTDSRILIKRLLVKAGAHVVEADCASAARQALEVEIPQLIISDIGMPNESGLEFMSALRLSKNQQAAAIPAIALTAYVRSEEKDGIMKAGFQAHVAKPVSRDALMAAIAETLRAH